MVSTVAWLPSDRVSGSSSTTGRAGSWVRTLGTLGAMGRRGRSERDGLADRKSTRLNSSPTVIYTLSYTTLFRSVSGSSSTTGRAGSWVRTLGTLGAMGRRGRSERDGL